ncbi:MAG: TonB-dependent receptor [Melioribacteraceae bacterium]|nr:TonB-dependent receptor [Melioribacteraceae bacterium]
MLKIFRFFAIIFLTITFTLTAGTAGKISGVIIDSDTGAPLIGVNIIIEETMMGASTNVNGEFTILNVPPGIYTVKISMIGYADYRVQNVRVIIDRTTNLDAELKMSAVVGEEVVVEAIRPVVVRDITNSQMNVTSQTIESLPVSKVDRVLSLQAGIEQGSEGIIVRGGSSNQTILMVDGLSQNDERSNIPYTAVSLSSIKEVQIQTGGFNAEYGNVRSGLVNIITKEGGNKKYSGTITFRVSPAQSKHFGHSIYDPNSYFNRPYLDPDVAWTGTNNGAWDQYTQGQYYIFEGWNAVSERTLQDKDPTNDLTPQGAQRLFQWQRRRQGDIEKPDYIVDLGFGGPFPFVGDMLGNLRFYISYFKEQNMFVFPLSRDNYGSNHTQLKFNSEINPSMKLLFTGLYGEVHSVSPYSWKTTPTGRVLNSVYEVANLTNSSSGNSVLYMPGYYSPSSIYRTFLNAKFLHVLSPVTYYEVRLQYKINNYSTYQMSDRDITKNYEPVPGYFTDEAPYGYWGFQDNAIDGMSMGGWMNLGRDATSNSTTSLSFDITSQINQQNHVKAGIIFDYNDFDIESGTYSPSMTTWTRDMVYRIFPFRVGAYIQDKLEFEGFIMNVGLRFDYSSSNVLWYVLDDYDKNLSAGYGNSLEENTEREKSESNFNISPRIGVAHPITENSKLYFNYGHFRSEPASSYRFRLQRESNGLVTSIGDPNILLQKTVAYELGYSQNLFDLFLLNIAAYYKDVTDQPGWIYYQNLNSTVQYNKAASNNYQDIRGFEITISKTRGEWIRGFINYTYDVRTSGYFGYTRYYEDPIEQREYLRLNPYQEKPLPRPYARANIEILTPEKFGPSISNFYPFDKISLNILADWKKGSYETYNPNNIPGIINNVEWNDWFNIDLRLAKVFDIGFVSTQIYLDISNLLDTKHLSSAGFADNFDRIDYMNSLNFSWEDGVENGDDKIGDYRPVGVEYDPLEFNPDNDPEIDKRNEERKETKSYINMPNIEAFTFLNPRRFTLGIKIDF